MTIAYTVAASLFLLIEVNVITQLLGWQVSERAGIANPENYALWTESLDEPTKRAIRLQQYWNAISKTALCAVMIATMLSTEPLVRCTTSVFICLCVTTFYVYMGPTLRDMEDKGEVAQGQYKAVHFLVIFLVLLFTTVVVLEGIEIARTPG
ncbi:hypothetical protein MHU86_1554 [Fragilaria crotonensis]|nr:hypothetical protein MHU86_1554 [Fragilaria crotonensis]